jgi:hypothetical protein
MFLTERTSFLLSLSPPLSSVPPADTPSALYTRSDYAIDTSLRACSKLEKFRTGFSFVFENIQTDKYDEVSITEMSLPLNRIVGAIGYGTINLANFH